MMSIRTAANRAGDHPLLEKGARLGYVASALLHVLIAWVILQLAWDVPGGGGEADEQGALRTIAGTGVGSVLLWLTIVGFVLLAVWQATEAVARGGTGDRLKAAGKAVVYLALGWTAFTVVQGTDSGGSESFTAPLLATTWGRLVIGAAGVAVVGVGIYHVVKGWTCRFLSDLVEHPGTWAVRAGRIGYVAKGIALMLVGGFLVAAAATAESDQPQGLDAVLRTVAGMPAGTAMLTLAALGFAAYGVYSLARARYGRF